LIELVRDGDHIPDHLARVHVNGKYTRAWPDYDSRVVDFRFTGSRQNDRKYIYVGLELILDDLDVELHHVQVTMATFDKKKRSAFLQG